MAEYKIPEAGLNAAWSAVAEKMRAHIDAKHKEPIAELHAARIALEAFIRWQSENPIVPTPKQARELFEVWWGNDTSNAGTMGLVAAAWQRRMYLAPEEPEVPAEVKDLLYDPKDGPTKIGRNEAICEAFRRGQQNPLPTLEDHEVEAYRVRRAEFPRSFNF